MERKYTQKEYNLYTPRTPDTEPSEPYDMYAEVYREREEFERRVCLDHFPEQAEQIKKMNGAEVLRMYARAMNESLAADDRMLGGILIAIVAFFLFGALIAGG